MPKRKSSSSARTRPYKKAKYSRTYASSVGRVTGPLRLERKLRYVDKFTIDPSFSSAIGAHRFRANGCFDPDHTGTGHQPLGFDQYMAMYDHFKVLSSKITIHVVGGGDGVTPSFVTGIYLDDDSSAIFDSNNMIEQGLTSFKVVNAGRTSPPAKISKSFNSDTFFGDQKMARDLMGTEVADPMEEAFFTIFVQAIENSVDVSPVTYHVMIDYVVSFSERATLATS